MEKYIKIGLAILFVLCLAPMPYGYYQLVRFLALMGFLFLAYKASQKSKETEKFVFIALAILFQPFYKIALGRMLWNIVDIIVAIGMLFSAMKANKNLKI